MAKDTQKREGRSVSLEDYESGRSWRETYSDIKDILGRDPDEITLEENVGRLVLRLLDADKAGATDCFVQLVSLDSLSDEPDEEGLVTVRPVIDDNTGRAEYHRIIGDGKIITFDGNGSENGYFVGGSGNAGDELGNHAIVELIHREEPALKAISLDFPPENY